MKDDRRTELTRLIGELEQERNDAIRDAMLSPTIVGGFYNERARELTARIDEARRELEQEPGPE